MVAAPGKKKKTELNLIWPFLLDVIDLALSDFAISPSLLISQRRNSSNYQIHLVLFSQTHSHTFHADTKDNIDDAHLDWTSLYPFAWMGYMPRINFFILSLLSVECAGKIGKEHVNLLRIIGVMSHLPLPWLQRYKPLVKSPLMQHDRKTTRAWLQGLSDLVE